jgi:hypothetical protein
MNEKELRMVEYALHTLLSNWCEEDDENMADDNLNINDVEKFTNWVENQIEENNSRK